MTTEAKVKAFLQDIITPEFLELVEKWSKYDGEKFSIGDADVYIEDLGTWKGRFHEHDVTLLRDAATCSNYCKFVLISEKRHELDSVLDRHPKVYIYCVFDKLEEGEDACGLIYADDSNYTHFPSLERLKRDFESGQFMHHNSLLHEFCGVYQLVPFNEGCDRISNFTVIEFNLGSLECEMDEDVDYAKHIPIIKRPENKYKKR